MPNWFTVNSLADGEDGRTADVSIYDQIGKDWWSGDGTTASEFTQAVEALGDLSHINLYINSPGGDVYDGLTIHNYLKRHKAKVSVFVDGLAASIASVIAMAGDEIHMPENTQMMIHNPWSWAVGDADEMRKRAKDLDKVKDNLISTYVNFTGKDRDEISALMDEETYMNGKEAVEHGFATQTTEQAAQIANAFNMADVKAKVQAKFEASKPKLKETSKPPQDTSASPIDILNLCAEQNLDFLAKGFIEKGTSLAQVKNELKQAADIQDICAAANLKGDSQTLIAQMDSPAEMMRTVVTNLKAEHTANIDGGEPAQTSPDKAKKGWNNAFHRYA